MIIIMQKSLNHFGLPKNLMKTLVKRLFESKLHNKVGMIFSQKGLDKEFLKIYMLGLDLVYFQILNKPQVSLFLKPTS